MPREARVPRDSDDRFFLSAKDARRSTRAASPVFVASRERKAESSREASEAAASRSGRRSRRGGRREEEEEELFFFSFRGHHLHAAPAAKQR